MSHRAGSKQFITPLLVLLTLFITVPTNGQTPAAAPSRNQLLTTAREIIASARYAALITKGTNGRISARTMDPFTPEADMVIWFGTNPRSRKVREIQRNPQVTIYYVDPVAQAYVSIQGTARLINDPQEKERYWKDEWKTFYPDRDQNYLLIAVKPQRLEVISVKAGLTGDPITWEPHSVTFK
jgi:general stress protein 26